MLAVTRPHDGILELRLNRPQRLNALTLELTRELAAAVHRAQSDDTVRVLLLTAEGRGFCAGKDRDDPATSDFVQALQQLALSLMEGPKPVVAAVQGWAVGAGLELLLNCDIVVAASSARFMLPEVTIGLFGTGGVVALLPRAMGMAKAKGALMLGQEFSARQAEQWGLIWSVVEDEEAVRDSALAIARRLVEKCDAAVLAAIKASLHEEAVGSLADILRREGEIQSRLGGT